VNFPVGETKCKQTGAMIVRVVEALGSPTVGTAVFLKIFLKGHPKIKKNNIQIY
jgi:hypothetical protein